MKTLRKCMMVLFIGLSYFSTAQDVETIGLGSKAPGLEMPLLTTTGQTTNLEREKGSNGLIVIFSCNTCPFVVGNEEFPGWERTYNSIYEQAKALGIQVILVNSNEAKRAGDDSPEAMQKHATAMEYKMPYLIDANSALANLFGAKTTPHVFIFNSNFELIYTGCIDNTYDSKRKKDELYLLNLLAQLQNKQAIQPTSTPPRGCSIKRVKL